MTCMTIEPNVTVCTAGIREIRRRVFDCPVCKHRRRFVVVEPESPYCSSTMTCLACGDSWQDGELLERPFQRGWREKAKAKARGRWANAFRQTPEQRAAWRARWFAPTEGVTSP